MNGVEEPDDLRSLLYSIAQGILGDSCEAEAAVQQAWLRRDAAPAELAAREVHLAAEVTRIAMDSLRPAPPASATMQPAPHVPAQPPVTDPVLLERVPLLERSVFVLREIFGCDWPEIAAAVGRSQTACQRLAAAAAIVIDDHGMAPIWPRRIVGAERVARVLAAISPALSFIGVTMRDEQVNGSPGGVFTDQTGTVIAAAELDVVNGQIQAVRWLRSRGGTAAKAGLRPYAPAVT